MNKNIEGTKFLREGLNSRNDLKWVTRRAAIPGTDLV
jgi:hypothetical protein